MEYEEFLSRLSNPARSAFDYEGIHSFHILASLSKKRLLGMHGIGPKAIMIIEHCLERVGMKLSD